MKLPSLQFYPGDWKKDPGVQALDFFARGVWFEILLLMHESDRRGHLLLNGLPMPEEALANLLGLPLDLLKQNLSKIEAYGVASRDQESGALICRRMVRDEEIRKIRSEAGKQGGNPALLKQNSTTGDKQNPTPSSSSSTSSSEEEGAGLFESPESYSAVLDCWNETSNLPKVIRLTTKRKSAINARLTDKFFRENFRAAVAKVASSPFCTGQNGGTWRADLDWFVKPDSVLKIMEGKYDSGEASRPAAAPPRPPAAEPPSWRDEWERLRPRDLTPPSWSHVVGNGFAGWLLERSETLRTECDAMEGRAA